MQHDYPTYIDNAISWATQRLGATDYTTLCLAFVEDAYERANSVEIFAGDFAAESGDIYSEHMRDGVPEIGSFVFYDCDGVIEGKERNWGHVALAMSNGDVIHAWDKVRVDNYLDIENLVGGPGWGLPTYRGWVPKERIFLGARPRDWDL
jgi:hypothetical protein